jgi:hypothetical protein
MIDADIVDLLIEQEDMNERIKDMGVGDLVLTLCLMVDKHQSEHELIDHIVEKLNENK